MLLPYGEGEGEELKSLVSHFPGVILQLLRNINTASVRQSHCPQQLSALLLLLLYTQHFRLAATGSACVVRWGEGGRLERLACHLWGFWRSFCILSWS